MYASWLELISEYLGVRNTLPVGGRLSAIVFV